MCAESALKGLLLKREKQHDTHVEKGRRERVEKRKLDRQIKKLNEADDDAEKKRELSKRRRTRERLAAKHKANKDKRTEKKAQLEQTIDDQRQKVRDADKRMAESVRKESRLEALIEEQYLRLDTNRKAFMDAVRISSRNIFCKLAMQFRPLYNNYRDDHFIVRELTRAAGIIHKRNGMAHLLLMPTMQFQPATRHIVQTFLTRMSQQINDHFKGRSMPIHIHLLDEDSNDLDINQGGLKWVSSPP
jgi:flagellar biosynthesis GTPase FlhF